MSQIVGYLPDATPGTTVVIYKFASTGLTAAIEEAADYIAEQRLKGVTVEALGFRINDKGIHIDLKETRGGLVWNDHERAAMKRWREDHPDDLRSDEEIRRG